MKYQLMAMLGAALVTLSTCVIFTEVVSPVIGYAANFIGCYAVLRAGFVADHPKEADNASRT